MACAKYCYDKTVSADKVMACALEHWPPRMQVARDAAQRPLGINGINSEGWNLLHFAASLDYLETGGLAIARGVDPAAAAVSRWGLEGRTWAGPDFHQYGKTLTPLYLAVMGESLSVLRVLLIVPKVRDQLLDKQVFNQSLVFAMRKYLKMLSLLLEVIASMEDLSRMDYFPLILQVAVGEGEGYLDALCLVVEFLIAERSCGFSEAGWRLPELVMLAMARRSMEMVGFLLDSFGIAVLGPNPSPSGVYNVLILGTVFDSRNNVAILKKLRVLPHTLMGSEEFCPPILRSSALGARVPIRLEDLPANFVAQVAKLGLELQEPAPENASFLAEWITEYSLECDVTPNTAAKRRRIEITQKGSSV